MRTCLRIPLRSLALLLLSLFVLAGVRVASAQPRPGETGKPPVLATASAAEPVPIDSAPLYVEWNGSYWPARILRRIDAARVVITYLGWGAEWDETVGAERMAYESPAPRRGYRVGDAVYVEWRGSHWPATVRARVGEKLKIHYEGWGQQWDETVGPERVKALRLAVQPAWPPGLPAVGRAVEVLWGGQWWPATITAVRPGRKALIHYDGWGAEWDETVGPERVRLRR